MSFAASQDRSVVHSEFASDPEYRELLEMFAEAIPERQRCLRAAFQSGNVQELRMLSHQLKGAGGGFGFPGLTELASRLESACKLGAPDEIAPALDHLLDYMTRITL